MTAEMQERATEKRLRHSRYNYFVERDDGVMGYNARTGTFALLSAPVASALRVDGLLHELGPDEVADLLDMGFLHDGEELGQVMDRFDQARTRRRLGLTIAPTLACNFSCDYCFQNEYRDSKVMSQAVQDATVKYATELVQSGRTNVSVDWYGGEPLLVKDIVVKLTRRLCEEFSKLNADIRGMRIITNGSLMDCGTARELSSIGIRSAQITFDALRYDGGKKRGIVGADGKPSLILRNAIAAQEWMSVSFRINVSKSNEAEVGQILDILQQNGFEKSYYLARIEDADAESNCMTKQTGERVKTDGLLSLPIIQQESIPQTRREFAKFEIEASLMRPEGVQEMIGKLTPRKGHYCGATDGSLYLVDPAGFISRCWMSAGSQSEAMGNVLDLTDDVDQHGVARRWREYSPFAYPSCKNCKVLPLCTGGCSHPRLFMEAKHPPCEAIKHQIQYCVDQIGGRLRVAGPVRNK